MPKVFRIIFYAYGIANLQSTFVAVMETPTKPKMGRPTKAPERLKRPRTLSFTDAEYAKLGELAAAEKFDRSGYIIYKLGLDK